LLYRIVRKVRYLNSPYTLRMRVNRKPIPAGETYTRDTRRISSRNSLIGRCSAGDYDRYSCVCIFFYHAGRLSSRTANHTPGEINPVQNRIADNLVHRVMPSHVTAFYDTDPPMKKYRAMDPPVFYHSSFSIPCVQEKTSSFVIQISDEAVPGSARMLGTSRRSNRFFRSRYIAPTIGIDKDAIAIKFHLVHAQGKSFRDDKTGTEFIELVAAGNHISHRTVIQEYPEPVLNHDSIVNF
jgi:hypothetical protein